MTATIKPTRQPAQVSSQAIHAVPGLTPYVPRLVVDWMSLHPDRSHVAAEGTLAFVDISGFTKLSERLARRGKVGAEELADTINACFSELLAVAYDEAGGLLKFGGDALLLWFSGADHEQRACRAAIGMRSELRRIGTMDVSGQQVSLRMSVGVHSGVFHFFVVGGSHREFLVTGPAATTTVTMEATAEAGEILVSDSTAAALKPSLIGAPKGSGHLLRRPPPAAVKSGWNVVADPPGVDVSAFIPVAIRSSLLSGAHEPEHRRVTVAFVHFGGTDGLIETAGPAEAARRLDHLVGEVQRAADQQGITFLATDVDRDGGKIILAAGAPSSSGDDERRMLLALRDIIDTPLGLPVRIGVNRGGVLAGDIGPRYRRTFTVMGDTVNLAARLMAKASPGQILATGEVIERSPTRFTTSALEPFMVKGKARPVQAHLVGPPVGARLSAAGATVPFVGRRAELDVLLEAASSARRGQGSLIDVVGEPGLGKSRLLEELRRRCDDMVQLTSACELYESSMPYAPFRRLVRGLLGIPEKMPDDAARQLLGDVLAQVDPTLAPWTPLVAAVVDVQMAETEETAQLEERYRPARLGEIMADLLGRLLPGPTLLSFEDTHWMDDASAELLGHIAQAAASRPWLICVARRGEDTGFAPSADFRSVPLRPLPPEEVAKLVHAATEDAPIAPHEMTALAERSGGNPLFLRELLATAGDGGVAALPDSIEAVIAARIDRLLPGDRSFLRRASVLGRSFTREAGWAVLGAVPSPDDEVWSRLDGFLRWEGSGQLMFDHALVRDSAYEGLPYRLRRELHAQAGDFIRRAAGPSPEDQAALLSLHYLHADRHREAWSWALVGAERAKMIYANVEAAELYERALEAGRRLVDADPLELSETYEALGDVRHRVGDYAAADRAYRAARRRIRDDRVAEARLVLKLASLQGYLDRYSRALNWISRGLRILEGVDSTAGRRQRAQLLAWYAHFCQDEGRHSRAIGWCQRAIDEAEAAGDRDALAHALRILDWALMDLGRLDQPDNFVRSLTLYEELGDLPSAASVLNMLGGVAYWRGDWPEALTLYQRALETVRRTGNTIAQAFCMHNIGEIYLDQGRLDAAADLLGGASRIWQAAGYRSGVAGVRCNLARLSSRLGQHAEALRVFGEALAEARSVGAQGQALELSARMAECLLAAGDSPGAVSLAERTLDQARSLGGVASQTPLLYRISGVGHLRLGNLRAARDALEQSLVAGQARRADYEVALTLLAEHDLAAAGGASPARDGRADALAILDRLGVDAPSVVSA